MLYPYLLEGTIITFSIYLFGAGKAELVVLFKGSLSYNPILVYYPVSLKEILYSPGPGISLSKFLIFLELFPNPRLDLVLESYFSSSYVYYPGPGFSLIAPN